MYTPVLAEGRPLRAVHMRVAPQVGCSTHQPRIQHGCRVARGCDCKGAGPAGCQGGCKQPGEVLLVKVVAHSRCHLQGCFWRRQAGKGWQAAWEWWVTGSIGSCCCVSLGRQQGQPVTACWAS